MPPTSRTETIGPPTETISGTIIQDTDYRYVRWDVDGQLASEDDKPPAYEEAVRRNSFQEDGLNPFAGSLDDSPKESSPKPSNPFGEDTEKEYDQNLNPFF